MVLLGVVCVSMMIFVLFCLSNCVVSLLCVYNVFSIGCVCVIFGCVLRYVVVICVVVGFG